MRVEFGASLVLTLVQAGVRPLVTFALSRIESPCPLLRGLEVAGSIPVVFIAGSPLALPERPAGVRLPRGGLGQALFRPAAHTSSRGREKNFRKSKSALAIGSD